MNKFCMHCGSQVKETDVFCSNCGSKVGEQTCAAINADSSPAPAQPIAETPDPVMAPYANTAPAFAAETPPKKKTVSWVYPLIAISAIVLALLIMLVMLITNVVIKLTASDIFSSDNKYSYEHIVHVDPFEDDELLIGGDDEWDEEEYQELYNSEQPYTGPITALEGSWYFSVNYDDYWADGETTNEFIGFECYIEVYDEDEVMIELLPTYGYMSSYDNEDNYSEYTLDDLADFEQGVVAKYDNGVLYFTLDMYQELEVELAISTYSDGSIDGWFDTQLTDTGAEDILESYCYVYMFAD